MKFSSLFITVFIILNYNSFSQVESVLLIGIKEAPPFVEYGASGKARGMSLDFFDVVDDQLKLKYEFVRYEKVNDLLKALKNREVDMSINPISVSDQRMEYLSFSQPFYISGTAVVQKKKSRWQGILQSVLSWEFWSAVLVLLAVIFVFGFLVWLFERRKNKEQFSDNARGLADGFWWSAVTMTTVGYGDKAPLTRGGRIVGFIWMFAAIIMISSLTAGIASALTVSGIAAQINSVEDLHKFKVGTIATTGSADYLEIFKVDFDHYTSVEEGLAAVNNGEIDAFVYDRPILRDALLKSDYSNLQLLKRDLKTDYYSFSFPKGSALRDVFDPVIVRALKSPAWNRLLRQFEAEE